MSSGTVFTVILVIAVIGITAFTQRKVWFPKACENFQEWRRKRKAERSAGAATGTDSSTITPTPRRKKLRPGKWWIRWPVTIGLVAVACAIGWHLYWKEVPELDASTKNRGTNSSGISGLPLLPENAENKAGEEKFWKENVPENPEDAQEMFEIGGRESKYNQQEADGTPYWGRVTPEDCGLYQINVPRFSVQAESIGYDICNKLEDNRQMALLIYRLAGPGEWNTGNRAKWPKRSIDWHNYDTPAPLPPKVSIRVPLFAANHNSVEGPVTIFDRHGNKFECDKETCSELKLPDAGWVVYQSRTDEPVTIHVRESSK